MADPDRDEKLSAGYRALGSEEPPRALDEAILAASRRRRLQWALPVSIAAVIVLAVGVTLRVQLEQPEVGEPVAISPQVLQAPAAPPPVQERPLAARPGAAQRGAVVGVEPPKQAPRAAEPASAMRAAPAPARAEARVAAEAESAERWLERIAQLREQGRGREADEALAEFRRRHPAYKIPDAMRERVERTRQRVQSR